MKTKNEMNGISRHAFLRTLALATPLMPAVAFSQGEPTSVASDLTPIPESLQKFVDLARSDLRLQKALIVAQNLPLTDPEAMDFWPMHREYEEALTKLLDERLAGIVQFARQYGSMSDEQATGLATKSFDIEEKRTALKRKYFKKFSSVVPAVKAARFFQIENQLNLALDLQVASSLPLIK